MDWDVIFALPDIKILLYLHTEERARYSELLKKVVTNRGSLAKALRDLQRRRLVRRLVESTTPVHTNYMLTPKGKTLAGHLIAIRELVPIERKGQLQ